jgi:hypothetical protein
VGINLTPKGWAAASPGTLDAPQAERVCGHACLICQSATLSPAYRDWARLAIKIADTDAWLAEHPEKATSHVMEYRAKLIAARDAARDAI